MNSATESDPGGYDEERRKDILFPILAAIVVTVVAVYDVLGVVFLVRDANVMSFCRPSSDRVHVVWQTSLWTYVLASLVFTTSVACMLTFVVPVGRTNSEVQKHMSGVASGHGGTSYMSMNVSGGRKPFQQLPDWDLLAVGSAFISAGLLLGLMAFWGYFELFVARVWCDDKKTAYEELDLWKFGRFSFWGQAIGGVVLFVAGFLYLTVPFLMELTSPASLGEASRGAQRIASYNMERKPNAEDSRRFQP